MSVDESREGYFRTSTNEKILKSRTKDPSISLVLFEIIRQSARFLSPYFHSRSISKISSACPKVSQMLMWAKSQSQLLNGFRHDIVRPLFFVSTHQEQRSPTRSTPEQSLPSHRQTRRPLARHRRRRSSRPPRVSKKTGRAT